jgi:hypothetical protein
MACPGVPSNEDNEYGKFFKKGYEERHGSECHLSAKQMIAQCQKQERTFQGKYNCIQRLARSDYNRNYNFIKHMDKCDRLYWGCFEETWECITGDHDHKKKYEREDDKFEHNYKEQGYKKMHEREEQEEDKHYGKFFKKGYEQRHGKERHQTVKKMIHECQQQERTFQGKYNCIQRLARSDYNRNYNFIKHMDKCDRLYWGCFEETWECITGDHDERKHYDRKGDHDEFERNYKEKGYGKEREQEDEDEKREGKEHYHQERDYKQMSVEKMIRKCEWQERTFQGKYNCIQRLARSDYKRNRRFIARLDKCDRLFWGDFEETWECITGRERKHYERRHGKVVYEHEDN